MQLAPYYGFECCGISFAQLAWRVRSLIKYNEIIPSKERTKVASHIGNSSMIALLSYCLRIMLDIRSKSIESEAKSKANSTADFLHRAYDEALQHHM